MRKGSESKKVDENVGLKQEKGAIELKKVVEVDNQISIDFGEEMVMEEFKSNYSGIEVH